MDVRRILRKMNFLCRAGDSIAFRPKGVESGNRSLWMRTQYQEEQPPVDPPGPIFVSSHVTRTANTDGAIRVTEDEIVVEGCVLEVARGDEPPTQPEIPWREDLDTHLQLSTKNLETILKAAKAAKAETLNFFINGSDTPVAFSFGRVEGVVMPCRGDD